MPRVAAMLASVVLIVSSIGINIARYPTVGQLAQTPSGSPARPPALAHELPETAAVSHATQPSVVSNAVKVESKPTTTRGPAVELVDVAPSIAPSVTQPVVLPDANKAPSAVPIRIVAIRPVVSQEAENPFVAPPAGQIPTEMSESVVQRLPPIDRVMLADQPQGNTAIQAGSYPVNGAP